MSEESIEITKIKVTKSLDGVRKITLSPDYFFRINSYHTQDEGTSLFELFETNAAAGYDYLRQAIGLSALKHAHAFRSYDVQAITEIDGSETTRQVARETLLERLPPSYEGPFNVAVHLFTSADEEVMGLGVSSLISQFRVEPPSLAM
jgi:hypothetical protein